MHGGVLDINLFGACVVESSDRGRFSVTGAKQKALFALLATAPFGRRTRSFLQETLWGVACYDTGRQSLRRALADIRQVLGDSADEVLSSTNADVTLDLSKVRFVGHPGAGVFLEGLDVREPGFQQWVNGVRQSPAQIAGLFSRERLTQFPTVLPVVAVLPFRAVRGEAGDEVLGDWLAEEICRSLSRSSLMAVISHLSCRELARGAVDIAAIRALLRADYCVVGTLRRDDGRLVLDADFVETQTGRILWTRRFAHDVRTFLSASGEGLEGIVSAVGGAVADDALVHVRGQLPRDIDDSRLLIAGVSLMHRATLRDFARSRELLEEAARRAPHVPEVHAWLGKWHVLGVTNRWSTDVGADTRRALDHTGRALDLSPNNAFCLTIDGFAQNSLRRDLDVAERRYAAALDRNPSEALAWLMKASLHTFRYEGGSAVEAARKARSLSPIDPFGHYYDALEAGANLSAENYERALFLAERSLLVNDRHLSTIRIKIVALSCLGRGDEARAAGGELLKRQPDFRVDDYMKFHPCAGFEMGAITERALRAAGLP